MPQPDLSSDYLNELEVAAEASFSIPGVPNEIKNSKGEIRKRFKILFKAGEWLRDEVLNLGATEKQAEDCTFAFGQRCSAVSGLMNVLVFFPHITKELDRNVDPVDYWEIAKTQLERFKNNDIDVPGLKLSDSLIAEQIRIISEQANVEIELAKKST